METAFGDRIIHADSCRWVIFAVIGYFLPALLFSGETQIFTILENPAGVGSRHVAPVCCLEDPAPCAFLQEWIHRRTDISRALLLHDAWSRPLPGLSIRTGWHLRAVYRGRGLRPRPRGSLTAILLIFVMSKPSPELTVLVVTSATTSLVLGALLKQMKARRTQNQAAPVSGPP